MNPTQPDHVIEDELKAVASFLCNSYPDHFKLLSEDSLEVTDPRSAILMASVVRDSFFIVEDEHDKLSQLFVNLRNELASKWAEDYQNELPRIFEGKKKIVRFFSHRVPMAGYSWKGADYRTRRRVEEMLEALRRQVVEDEGKELADVLFLPYFGYSKGVQQLGESVYHFIAGMVFRSMGYLVLDEYSPTVMTGTARTPDISAFRTPEVVDLMKQLRASGVISSGAFLQELQLYGLFGRQRPVSVGPPEELTDAESVVVEVKRSESQYLVGAGSRQLSEYLSETYGFYDEGYLAGPFMTGPGTISIDAAGALLFERPAPSTSVAMNDYWKEKRTEQLMDVRTTALLQVLKSKGLPGMVEACGGKEEVRTYADLVRSLNELDAGELIGDL